MEKVRQQIREIAPETETPKKTTTTPNSPASSTTTTPKFKAIKPRQTIRLKTATTSESPHKSPNSSSPSTALTDIVEKTTSTQQKDASTPKKDLDTTTTNNTSTGNETNNDTTNNNMASATDNLNPTTPETNNNDHNDDVPSTSTATNDDEYFISPEKCTPVKQQPESTTTKSLLKPPKEISCQKSARKRPLSPSTPPNRSISPIVLSPSPQKSTLTPQNRSINKIARVNTMSSAFNNCAPMMVMMMPNYQQQQAPLLIQPSNMAGQARPINFLNQLMGGGGGAFANQNRMPSNVSYAQIGTPHQPVFLPSNFAGTIVIKPTINVHLDKTDLEMAKYRQIVPKDGKRPKK